MEHPQSLSKAFHLYQLLGKHIPEFSDIPDNYLDFIGRIITSIKEKQDYSVYFDAIQIMNDVTYNTLSSTDPNEVLRLFSDGLIEWKIVELVRFFREVGYPDD